MRLFQSIKKLREYGITKIGSCWIQILICVKGVLRRSSTPSGGHSGFYHTLHRIKHSFLWVGMMSYIRNAVKECDLCQHNKRENLLSPGLLQPLPITDKAWEDISIDFVEGLPVVQAKSVVMVVVDRLTKFAHFYAVKHPYTVQQIAQILFMEVLKLDGVSKSIVSDRNRVFLSEFWQELFQMQGFTLKLSTSYNPQCLETYLHCFCNNKA